MKKYNTKTIIEKFRSIHGDKYDYSKTIYDGIRSKVCIICKEHGEFYQTPDNHIKSKHPCLKCFAEHQAKCQTSWNTMHVKCQAKYGEKFDYSKVRYKNNITPVCIICKEHGEFEMTISNHLRSHTGCPKCKIRSGRIKWTTEDFIRKAKAVHGDKYDYSNTIYIDSKTKVDIICKKCGTFKQSPSSHLRGNGCKNCPRTINNRNETKRGERFIEKAKSVHGDRYDYSKVEYLNNCTKVCIICKDHGEFSQTPNVHLRASGCPECGNVNKYDIKDFISKSMEVHGKKYNYSLTEYVDRDTKVCIICKKHGEFWQKPSNHFNGCGCPICNESNGERIIRLFLEQYNIPYEPQFTPNGLMSEKGNNMSFDFYIPSKNLLIEYDGIQHFSPVEHFGGIEQFKLQKLRDAIKDDFCLENEIPLFRISYKDDIDNMLKEILDLY